MFGLLVALATTRGVAAARSAVALLMMDTRAPGLAELATRNVSLKSVSPFSLAYYLNLRFACAHSYDLIVHHLTEDGCNHPHWGRRHPSYCKLASIASLLGRGYEHVVFLD